MGKINQGILGGFNGKVGTVVGFFWKGRAVMRSLAGHVTNPRTPAQQAQRARFGIVANVAGVVRPVLHASGFIKEAAMRAVTIPNVFVQVNLAQAVSGTGTNVSIDWQHLLLSHGDLLGLANPTATPAATGHACELEWDNNSGMSPEASDGDIVCICLVNTNKMQVVYDLSTATRSNEATSISYPALWAGDTVQVYAWCRTISSQRGVSGDNAMWSTSVRIGSIVAA